MRTIRFRGKRIDNGEWVYGFFKHAYPDDYPPEITHWIEEEKYYMTSPVILESVGEFTGLTDKRGIEIYEGDILEIKWHEPKGYNSRGDSVITSVSFDKMHWSCGEGKSLYNYTTLPVIISCIGTIHDNQDLLPPPPMDSLPI